LQNYYGTFISNKVNYNNEEDLIKILIEIERIEDMVVNIKEEKKKIRVLKCNKIRYLQKY